MDEYRVASELDERPSFILEQAEYSNTKKCEVQKFQSQQVESVDTRYH